MSPQPAKKPASQNALKHGLASSTILIPGENPEELHALEIALFDQYKPANPIESLLVTDMVKHHWLKDRALRLQGEALATAAPANSPPPSQSCSAIKPPMTEHSTRLSPRSNSLKWNALPRKTRSFRRISKWKCWDAYSPPFPCLRREIPGLRSYL